MTIIQNPARILAWRTDRLYTNFYVAVDIVEWNTSIVRNTNRPLICPDGPPNQCCAGSHCPSRPTGLYDVHLNVNRFGGTRKGHAG